MSQANRAHVERLRVIFKKALAFERARLIQREEWGTKPLFDAYRDALDKFYFVITTLNKLPIEKLADAELASMMGPAQTCLDIIEKIDKYDTSKDSVATFNTQHLTSFKNNADNIFKQSAQLVPILAYMAGDTDKQLAVMERNLKKSEALLSELENSKVSFDKEADTIIAAMQAASASAGVAHFSNDFAQAAADQKREITFWGIVTLVCAVITLLATCGSVWLTIELPAGANFWFIFASKLVVLLILISATLWCSKMYKAEKHQRAMNKFKAHALKTFQAFSEAAPDPQTKSAVLLETCRAIFNSYNPGYLNTNGAQGDDGTTVFEFVRNVAKTSADVK